VLTLRRLEILSRSNLGQAWDGSRGVLGLSRLGNGSVRSQG